MNIKQFRQILQRKKFQEDNQEDNMSEKNQLQLNLAKATQLKNDLKQKIFDKEISTVNKNFETIMSELASTLQTKIAKFYGERKILQQDVIML
jgi:hypothetical protein